MHTLIVWRSSKRIVQTFEDIEPIPDANRGLSLAFSAKSVETSVCGLKRSGGACGTHQLISAGSRTNLKARG